jgi:hypothetical protein
MRLGFKEIICFYITLGSGMVSANSETDQLSSLSPPAMALVNSAFEGIDEGSNIDHHVHVVGIGDRVTIFDERLPKAKQDGCRADDFKRTPIYINPKRFSFFKNPILYIKTRSLMAATGVTDGFWNSLNRYEANNNYVRHLLNLVSNYRPNSKKPGKFLLLAMDGHYVNGEIDWPQTDLNIPSRYVIRLSDCMNKLYQTEKLTDFSPFMPAISIHPERADALERLSALSSHSNHLKWLPNTMNINPAEPKIGPFINLIKRLDITLITHTGHEEATEALDEHQHYGNPTLHQQALDLGVKVIMAHAGYKGTSLHHQHGEERDNTELFNEMLVKYPNSAKGGLSASVFIEKRGVATYSGLNDHQAMGPLAKQLQRFLTDQDELYAERLLYGSDYPLPSIGFLNPVNNLAYWGFLDEQQVELLNEIWEINPLLYDFVLKRTIHHPDNENHQLPDSMFMQWQNHLP